MKRILLSMMFLGTLYTGFAQVPEPGRPINPVTDQKQNINELAWDNSKMSAVQPSDVPSSVNTAFSNKYANQKGVTWYKYQSGYIANYDDASKVNQQVIYDMEGNLMYTGRRVSNESAPASIGSYMKGKYPNVTYDNIYEVTSAAGEKTYQVLVNGQWIRMDQNGNPIK